MNAANGTVLSYAALDLLIEMLEPNNLPEQYYFGTSKGGLYPCALVNLFFIKPTA
jgi:hypothetical protein